MYAIAICKLIQSCANLTNVHKTSQRSIIILSPLSCSGGAGSNRIIVVFQSGRIGSCSVFISAPFYKFTITGKGTWMNLCKNLL